MCIAFLLWNQRTFKIALIACVVFNVFNFLLFNFGAGGDIGIFPFFMIGACVLFC
ncbi:MAG: HTTM domain-containing protein [Bacteroidetes bacterium]|nr:HTTM domain-containing protein [Bacteroidota bacterium]